MKKTKKGTYPTWKKVSRGRWESVEGQPNGYGGWTPDFIIEYSTIARTWAGKMRTSAQWDRFDTASDAKLYYEQAMAR